MSLPPGQGGGEPGCSIPRPSLVTPSGLEGGEQGTPLPHAGGGGDDVVGPSPGGGEAGWCYPSPRLGEEVAG